MIQGSSRINLKVNKVAPFGVKRPLKRILPKIPIVFTESVYEVPQHDIEDNVNSKACYICDVELAKGIRLVDKRYPSPNVGLPAKIVELIGDSFIVIANEDDLICKKCHGMFLHVDKLEKELQRIKKLLRILLFKKYGIDDLNISDDGIILNPVTGDTDVGYLPSEEEAVGVPIKTKSKSESKHRYSAQLCTMCDFVCDTVRSLRQHKMSAHLTNWTCHFCNDIFTDESSFTDHTKMHLSETNNPTNIYTCVTCTETFTSETALVEHSNIHSQETGDNVTDSHQAVYTCPMCDVQFLEESSYTAHIQNHEALNSLDLTLVKSDLALHNFANSESVDLLDINMFDNGEPTIHDMKRFVCATCDSEHETLDALNKHFDAEHEIKQCSLCPQIVGSKEEVDAHVLEVHGVNASDANEMEIQEMICTHCGSKADCEEAIVHKQGCNLAKSLICSTCGAIAETEEILNVHQEVCNIQPTPNTEDANNDSVLNQNENVTSDLDATSKKSATEKKQRGITCAACGQAFANKHQLVKHEKEFPDHLVIGCPDCDLTFARESFLNEHRGNFHEICHCRHCGKQFTNIKQLKAHERRHIRAARESLQCSQCERVFQTQTGLRHHMSVHTGEYKFQCEFCGKGFVSRVRSEEHRACHTREERYTCEICDRKFVVQASYWIHKKWHDNPKPYECQECGMLFKHTSLLAVHKRKHTGERPYVCPYCEQTFVVSNSLKRHMALHTGSFPHTCSVCNVGFPEKHKLAQHMSKVHNDNELILEQMKNKNRNLKVAVKQPIEKTEQKFEETLVLTDSSAQYLTIETQEGERILLTESMLHEDGENQLVEIVLHGDQQPLEVQKNNTN